MQPSSLKEILNRYLNKKASEQDNRMVEAWFELMAEDENTSEQLQDEEMAQLYNRIRNNPRFTERSPEKAPVVRIPRHNWIAAAVVTGVLLTASLFYLLLKQQDTPSAIAFKEETTGKGQVKKITLPDNSVVWMNANTQLAYHPDFASNREIRLDGEAMFEVTPGREHPFMVLTRDSVQTTVLGTRFNISSYAQEQKTAISVLDGRVSVSKNKMQSVVLSKLEGIEYNAIADNFHSLKINDLNRIEGWINGEWEYDSLNIQELNRLLVNQYGVTVINTRKELGSVKVSSNFNREQKPDDILKIFCLLADCSYRWNNKTTIEVY